MGVVDLAAIVAERPLEAAPALLGQRLTVGSRSGRIVEVEAYEGAEDQASHASRGPTDRNRVMFGPPGRLYVYRSYGIHWCANIVCGPVDAPGAVLIRAIDPDRGIEDMWTDRPKAKRETDLASGPGKLCAALGIDGGHNAVDLLDEAAPVRLVAQDPVTERSVVAGPRIGITKAVERPWRFAIAGNQHVSRPRPPGFASDRSPGPADPSASPALRPGVPEGR